MDKNATFFTFNKFFFLTLFLLSSTLHAQTQLVGIGTLNDESIFAINEDGTNPEKWIDFSFPKAPEYTNLIESNGKLWGMTRLGGSSNNGVIFNLNTDGTDFTTVHDFDNTNGGSPFGSLVESNGKLWGMTSQGGSSNYGIIFNINTDGTGFTKVFDFDNTKGAIPLGSLVESNSKLWGMTKYGGSSGFGIIFNLNTDGTGFTKVQDFDNTNGSHPQGNLIESNGKLWGMTEQGGDSDNGVIFSVGTDGTGFSKLWNFTGEIGGRPQYSSLLAINLDENILGLQSAFENVNLYPNPAQDYFRLTGLEKKEGSF